MRELFDERDRAIAEQTRAQRFFADLERRVEPSTTEGLARVWIVLLQACLWQRVGLRASLARRISTRAPLGWIAELELPRGDATEALEQIEHRLRECVLEHYGDSASVAGIDWAFEAFVSGRLVTSHREVSWNERLVQHGAPNSANFFLFAELAFLCVEAGLAPEFWRGLIAPLVRCSHLLARFPDGVDGDRPDEVERFGHWEGRWVPMREIERVRAAHTALPDLRPELRTARLEDTYATLLGSALGPTATCLGGELRPIVAPIVVD